MTDVLKTLSTDLANLVEGASPALVRVAARRRIPATGIVWSADGLIVTAHHVVQRDDNIKVGLPDGQTTVEAELVGRDPTTDLALLRLNASNLTPAQWAADFKVGHLVLALGRPTENVQATLGVVSALEKDWRAPTGTTIDQYIQTDVVMYPGFSGGPLVSATGQFIGLNTSALVRGVSLTLPGATIRRVVETLAAHGKVKRGYLGVSTQGVRLPADLQSQLNQETGLLIVSVEPDSPAAKGGLLLGDTIVAFGETTVRQHDDLLGALTPERINTATPVKIIRGGQVTEVSVSVGERQ